MLDYGAIEMSIDEGHKVFFKNRTCQVQRNPFGELVVVNLRLGYNHPIIDERGELVGEPSDYYIGSLNRKGRR